jgi:hypothetical protein
MLCRIDSREQAAGQLASYGVGGYATCDSNVAVALIADGKGGMPLIRIKWRCRNCGSSLADFVVSGSHLRPQA